MTICRNDATRGGDVCRSTLGRFYERKNDLVVGVVGKIYLSSMLRSPNPLTYSPDAAVNLKPKSGPTPF